MPVQIQSQRFLLNALHSSYAFAVTEAGFLRHLHWGGKIGIGDLPCIVRNSLRGGRETVCAK